MGIYSDSKGMQIFIFIVKNDINDLNLLNFFL